MAERRQCKDCPQGAPRRPAPYPGPRCATHHRERQRAARRRAHRLYVARTYGIQPEAYDRLYEAQGGRCAICATATGRTKRLAVDHDHVTGEVRGLLCGPCNRMIGRLRDSAAALARAADYLLDPPARRILARKDQPREETA